MTQTIADQNFTTTFVVDQTPREVFNAVTNVRGWWSRNVEGDTDKLNAEFIFQVEGVHYSKMKIIEFIPDRKVTWLVEYNYLGFVKDKSEWTGTKVYFEITPRGDKTQLRFTHEGLVPQYECYDVCSRAWTDYVQYSLLNLITTGQGHPNLEESDPRTEK